MRILVTSLVDLERSAHNRPHEFVAHLSRNHDVTVLSIRDWWKESQVAKERYGMGWASEERKPRFVYLSDARVSPVIQELMSVVTLRGWLREFGRDFDVHLNYNSLVSGWAVARWLAARGIATVYDLADDIPAMVGISSQIPAPLRGIAQMLARSMFRANAAQASHITMTTSSIGVPREFLGKCSIVPNGVDTRLFKPVSGTRIRSAHGFGDGLVLGYVGVLREWVDLAPVCGALRDLIAGGTDAWLLVVGEEGGLERQKELARQYGVEKRVRFVGTVPYAAVPEYMSCMDIGLVPFKKNRVAFAALPLKVFEYMACEVPVVCARLPAVEAAVDGVARYYDDRAGLLDVVRGLAADRAERARLGQAGRALVEKGYAWDAIVATMERVLTAQAAPRAASM